MFAVLRKAEKGSGLPDLSARMILDLSGLEPEGIDRKNSLGMPCTFDEIDEAGRLVTSLPFLVLEEMT